MLTAFRTERKCIQTSEAKPCVSVCVCVCVCVYKCHVGEFLSYLKMWVYIPSPPSPGWHLRKRLALYVICGLFVVIDLECLHSKPVLYGTAV